MRLATIILLPLIPLGCTYKGCTGPERPATPKPPSHGITVPPPAPTETDVDSLRAQLAALNAERAALKSRLRDAEYEATVAPLRALTTWAAWIGGAVALLSVVALALMRFGLGIPLGMRTIAGIGATGLGLAACAVGLGQALPWIGPVGLASMALAIVGGLGWAAYTWRKAGAVAATEWRTYASHLPGEIRAKLDSGSRKAQGRLAAAVDALLKGKP